MRFVPHSLLATVLMTGPALAQAPTEGTPAKAEQPQKQLTAKEQAAIYFQEGRAFFKAKDFRKASERFQAAYNLDPVPILLYNLARASEEMGEPDKAIEHYRFYLKRLGPKAEDRGEVERRIRVMEKTVSAARRARVPRSHDRRGCEPPRPASAVRPESRGRRARDPGANARSGALHRAASPHCRSGRTWRSD